MSKRNAENQEVYKVESYGDKIFLKSDEVIKLETLY